MKISKYWDDTSSTCGKSRKQTAKNGAVRILSFNLLSDNETSTHAWQTELTSCPGKDLGKATGLEGVTPDTKSTVITLSYWKNLESLQAFAAGPAHQEGWAWWNRTAEQHPQLGIMHEVYAAPHGHWENIYVNFKPFGMGKFGWLRPCRC